MTAKLENLFPQNSWLRYFTGLLLFLILIGVYNDLAGRFFGLFTLFEQSIFELPFLILIFSLIWFVQKPSNLRFFCSAYPVFWIYLVHDQFCININRVPEWQDLLILDELFVFLPLWIIALIFLSFFVPLFFGLKKLDFKSVNICFLIAFFCLALVFFKVPESTFNKIERFLRIASWSDFSNVSKKGRIFMSLFRHNKSQIQKKSLKNAKDIEKTKHYLRPSFIANLNSRNIHLIVLESFINPKRFKKMNFNPEPIFEEFNSNFGPFFGQSESVVFGGGTARAEFEILCGLPSLKLLGTEEFNLFNGNKVFCLPEILNLKGYETIVSYPHNPEIFNAAKAYKSLAFKKRYYSKDFQKDPKSFYYEKSSGDPYITDEDLFKKNLKLVQKQLQNKKPFLNYIMTIYGHLPFDFNKEKRPEVISVSPKNQLLKNIANQHYYRTKALDNFLNNLIKLDPSSLILVISDHLPPIPGGRKGYKKLGYFCKEDIKFEKCVLQNFFLLIDAGQKEKWINIRHFHLYEIILDKLSSGRFCKIKDCSYKTKNINEEKYKESYLAIIKKANGF